MAWLPLLRMRHRPVEEDFIADLYSLSSKANSDGHRALIQRRLAEYQELLADALADLEKALPPRLVHDPAFTGLQRAVEAFSDGLKTFGSVCSANSGSVFSILQRHSKELHTRQRLLEKARNAMVKRLREETPRSDSLIILALKV